MLGSVASHDRMCKHVLFTCGEAKVPPACTCRESQLITNLLGSVDDSCVVAKLQRADYSGGQREQEVTCYLLFLQRGRGGRRRGEEEEGRKQTADEIKGGVKGKETK